MLANNDAIGYLCRCYKCNQLCFQQQPNYQHHGKYHQDKAISAIEMVHILENTQSLLTDQCKELQQHMEKQLFKLKQQVYSHAQTIVEMFVQHIKDFWENLKLKVILNPKAQNTDKVIKTAKSIKNRTFHNLTCDDVYHVYALISNISNKINQDFYRQADQQIQKNINSCFYNIESKIKQNFHIVIQSLKAPNSEESEENIVNQTLSKFLMKHHNSEEGEENIVNQTLSKFLMKHHNSEESEENIVNQTLSKFLVKHHNSEESEENIVNQTLNKFLMKHHNSEESGQNLNARKALL